MGAIRRPSLTPRVALPVAIAALVGPASVLAVPAAVAQPSGGTSDV